MHASNHTSIQGESDPDVVHARWELTSLATRRALESEAIQGFGWTPSPEPPATFTELKDAFQRSQRSHLPLPVNGGRTNSTLYLSEGAQPAFNFWRDVAHVTHGRSFQSVDALDVGLWQVAIAKAERLSSLALQLLEAETIGQILLLATSGAFPINTLEFDLDVVTFGVADAVVLERERRSDRASTVGNAGTS